METRSKGKNMKKIFCSGNKKIKHQSVMVIVFSDNSKPIIESITGTHTGNEMEYMAVIRALKEAANGDEILTNSSLVAGQLFKRWHCNAWNLAVYLEEAKRLLAQKSGVKIIWVPYWENLAAIYTQSKVKTKPKMKLIPIATGKPEALPIHSVEKISAKLFEKRTGRKFNNNLVRKVA
jgi:ribonuclease HI